MSGWKVAALTVGLIGCATEIPRVEPSANPLTMRERVVGSWKTTALNLVLSPEGAYRWMRIQSCAVPPCPVELDRGTFELTPTRLTLQSRRAMGRRIFTYRLGWNPRRLALSEASSTRVYNLAYRGNSLGR